MRVQVKYNVILTSELVHGTVIETSTGTKNSRGAGKGTCYIVATCYMVQVHLTWYRYFFHGRGTGRVFHLKE